jgi:hypothetical protein
MSTSFETAETSPIQIPGMAPPVQPHARHVAPEHDTPLVLHPQPARAISSAALVICVIVLGIAAVCIALAIAGDTTSAAMIAFFPIVLGFIMACIFHRRWR